MINLKVLSAAAAMALVLPIALPSASFAQNYGSKASGGGGAHFSGGGGGFRAGPTMGGGARFSGVAPGGGGARFVGGAGVVRGPVAGNWNGGVRGPAYAGGNWNGGYRYRHGGGGGFYPGLVAGALVGGAIGNSYAYYGPGYGYAPGYYDDGYYDDSNVAVAPGGDDVASCAQRYRSYDPASQTFLGYDGQRYPCP